MAKKRRAGARSVRKSTKPGGRAQLKPPWEAPWRRASKASSDLCWQAEALGPTEPTTGDWPPHGDVFRTLDALAATGDALGTLATLADGLVDRLGPPC